jgi:hypothetical protein
MINNLDNLRTVNKNISVQDKSPPHTFQIDMFWWKKAETLIPILFL